MDPADIIAAAQPLLLGVAQELFPREEEVESAAGFSEAVAVAPSS